MLTNRQWLESLTDNQLAAFLTTGLYVRPAHYAGTYATYINIREVAAQYTQSQLGIEKWLSMPQDFVIVEE